MVIISMMRNPSRINPGITTTGLVNACADSMRETEWA